MMTDQVPKKRGPKTPYDPSLGISENIGTPLPSAVRAMIKEWPVGRLLNRMVLDGEFKATVLNLLPEEDRQPRKPKSKPTS